MVSLQYIYIITGEEIARLAKDYKKVVDELWLEKAIINTPTWWDSPEKYRRLFRSYKESNSDK